MPDVFDYLPVVPPDYVEETLTIKPANTLDPVSDFLQRQKANDGGVFKTSTIKNTPEIFVTLNFQKISLADKNTLVDLYMNPNKALKTKRSFRWQHPDTDVVYTAIFTSPLQTPMFDDSMDNISVTIKVIGRVA